MRKPKTTTGHFPRELVALLSTLLCAVCVYLLVWAHDPDAVFWDDFQTQYLPATIEMGRALEHGEWPLLSSRSWFGGALAGEYQYGVFSPVELACAWLRARLDLPLTESVALLVSLHVALLATGAYTLARTRGLARDAACWVALAASLNGWLFGWGAINWYPAYTSFVWIPWSWAALERSCRSEINYGAIALAAVPMALVLLAGWPFATAMLALVTFYIVLRPNGGPSRLSRAARIGLAGALALGLSAPAWMTLLAHGTATTRASDTSRLAATWLVPWDAWPGMVIPTWSVLWHTNMGWVLSNSPTLFNGLVPVVGLMVGWRMKGREFFQVIRTEVFGIAALVLLASLPSVRPLQNSFRWLPLLHLVIALAGARGLTLESGDNSPTSDSKTPFWKRVLRRICVPRNRGFSALLLVGPVAFIQLMPGMAPTTTFAPIAWKFVLLALGWMVADFIFETKPLVLSAVAVGVAATTLSLTNMDVSQRTTKPRWALDEGARRPAPMEPGRLYLSLYSRDDFLSEGCCALVSPGRAYGTGQNLLPGNSGMYPELTMINGYSALRLRSMQAVFGFGIHGYHMGNAPLSVLKRHVGAGRLLDLAGVDGLVLPERLVAPFESAGLLSSWRAIGSRPGVAIYHRTLDRKPVISLMAARVTDSFDSAATLLEQDPGAAPVYLSARGTNLLAQMHFGEARLSHAHEARNQTIVTVTAPSDRDALLVFTRAWYPGFTATLNGRNLDVGTVDLIMPAVRVPARASGRLVLAYRPASVRYGSLLSGLSLVVLVALAVRSRRM